MALIIQNPQSAYSLACSPVWAWEHLPGAEGGVLFLEGCEEVVCICICIFMIRSLGRWVNNAWEYVFELVCFGKGAL